MTRWFGEYLEMFAACGRGERDAGSLLACYGVPWLIATDGGFTALVTEDQVVSVARQQIDDMRAATYDHTKAVSSEVAILNASAALYRGEFSRRRADGSEISRLKATYLLTDGPNDYRVSALLVHSR